MIALKFFPLISFFIYLLLQNVQSKPKNLRNLGQVFSIQTHPVFTDEQLKYGLQLITTTKNDVLSELSLPAQRLKAYLEILPYIPTTYVTYAYNHGKREALSVMVQYDIVLDM